MLHRSQKRVELLRTKTHRLANLFAGHRGVQSDQSSVVSDSRRQYTQQSHREDQAPSGELPAAQMRLAKPPFAPNLLSIMVHSRKLLFASGIFLMLVVLGGYKARHKTDVSVEASSVAQFHRSPKPEPLSPFESVVLQGQTIVVTMRDDMWGALSVNDKSLGLARERKTTTLHPGDTLRLVEHHIALTFSPQFPPNLPGLKSERVFYGESFGGTTERTNYFIPVQ